MEINLMLENLSNYRVVLASASPRRQELLKELGLSFTVRPASVDEVYPENLGMTAIPEFLSELKAEALAETMADDELIISADTIVWKEGDVLGKPANRGEACAMIRSLAGSQHEVITGVTLLSKAKKRSFHAVTEVWFEELTDEEINYYVDKYQPMDKAGAYGIQEWIGFVAVSKIEGSFYNVMGLPVHKLYHALKEF
ncbi:MAG: Maf-like protein [Mangrovibacterium sp.]